MLSFDEYLILESFDIKEKPKALIPQQYRKVIIDYLTPKYHNQSEVVMENMLRYFGGSPWVFKETIGNSSYMFLYGLTKDRPYYEIHFNDLDNIDDFSNLRKNQKDSLKVFSYAFNILYHYGMKQGHNIVLESHPDNNRTVFYAKIANKIIKDNNLKYEVMQKDNLLMLKNLTPNNKLSGENLVEVELKFPYF